LPEVFNHGVFWCKIDFMNDLPLFPIARSGNTRVIPESRDTFSVECPDISVTDKDALVEFFNQMQGRFRAFWFEHGATALAECPSIGDEGPATVGGPGLHNVAVRIKILRSGTRMEAHDDTTLSPVWRSTETPLILPSVKIVSGLCNGADAF
jgi:hypothetical protein